VLGKVRFMLDALLVFHDFPALQAKDISIAFLLRPLQISQKSLPVLCVFLDYCRHTDHDYGLIKAIQVELDTYFIEHEQRWDDQELPSVIRESIHLVNQYPLI
jgi:hypothetical protein